MIRGVVNAQGEAVISIRVRGGECRPEREVDVIVDSGYTETLTLPNAMVSTLGLDLQSNGTARMADGSRRQFEVFAAEVLWDDAWRPVTVWTVGSEALIGMRLLAGHELRVEVVPGGAVEISPLP